MEDLAAVKGKSKSPSSRRAWIEISASILHGTHAAVALLAEGVDRNLFHHPASFAILVALLAEGVDRNMQQLFAMQMQQVALLAEGVDRNRPCSGRGQR